MILRGLLLVAMATQVASEANAQAYRFPIDGGRSYPTAYVDHGGRDWHGGDWTYGGHGGSDYGIGGFPAMDAGRSMVAGAAGEVVAAHDGEFDRCTTADCAGGGGYGNHVRIRHGDGKETVYAHLRRGSVAVNRGARVSCGQRIGQVGSSGWSTGPHLHFEVKTAGGGTDDPFAGPRSGPLSYWVDQGAYRELPSTRCEGGGGPAPAPDPEPAPEPEPERRDDAEFISENMPDGTRIEAGQPFTKVWRLRNNGTTTWRQRDDYLLTWDGEERIEGPEQVILNDDDVISPGQEKEWRVQLTALEAPGRYKSFWRMDRFGTARFGERIWLDIEVFEGRRDDAELNGEDPPPGQSFEPGERFSKVLHVRNTGNRDWHMGDNYLLTWDGERRFSAPEQSLIPDDVRVRPGGEHTFEIPMQAPDQPGEYTGYWRMDRFGTARFGARFEVTIRVVAPLAAPDPPDGDDPSADGDPVAPDDGKLPAEAVGADDGSPAPVDGTIHAPTPMDDPSMAPDLGLGPADSAGGSVDSASGGVDSASGGDPSDLVPRVTMTGESGCSVQPGATSLPSPIASPFALLLGLLLLRRREWTARPGVLSPSTGVAQEEPTQCNAEAGLSP